MVTISSVVPSSLTICGDAKLFTVTIYNPSPFLITNAVLKVTLPTGILSQGPSVTGGTFVNNFGGILTVNLTNIPTLSSRVVTFLATAQCNVLTFISGGGVIKNQARLNYTANNMAQTDAVNSLIYLIKQPNLTITSISNQSYVGNIGDVFSRCITIINGGFGGLSGFTLTDIHASGVQINAVNKGTLTNVGLTAKVVIDGVDFAGVGNGDNVFDGGESITICETVTVLNCISAVSNFKAFWGCSVNFCQATVSTANVVFPNYVPNLVVTPTASMNSCLGAGNANAQQLKIINKGLGQAVNVLLEIFQATGSGYNGSVGSNIDVASLTIQVGVASAGIPIVPTSTQATASLNCMTSPIGKVQLTIPTINAGDTVYIKWNSYNCCYNSCGGSVGQHYINGWRYKGTYSSICQTSYVIYENWGRVYSDIYGALTPDGAPSTLSNGQTGTFNFLFSNYGNSFPVGPGAHWKFVFTVPSYPCLTYSNIRIISYNGGTWNPTTVTASGGTVTAIFNGSPPFTLTQAEVKVNLTLVCSSCPSPTEVLTALEVKSYYIPNNTCGCEIGVSCQTIPFNINCPDPCPAGILFSDFDMRRTSYGQRDNEVGGGNGIPDGGTVDLTKIKTNRSMFGDTITSMFSGVVNTSISHPTLQYCYATSSISNGNLLTFLDAQLLIYRSGSLLATCNSGFVPTITDAGTTRLFSYDLSVPALVASGCLPNTHINTEGDSLVFKPRYRVSTNIRNATPLNCYSTNKFYLSDIADPTAASDKYQCGNINGNFTVIGYWFQNWGGSNYGVKSCDNTRISQNYYLSIGPGHTNDAGGNLFPFEYRNWAHIKTLTATIPAGYDFISAEFTNVRTAGTLGTSSSGVTPITPINSNSDTLVFNVEPYFSGYGGLFPLGDDGFYGVFDVIIQPSCEVVPEVDLPILHDFTFSPNTYLTGPGSDTTFLSQIDDHVIYDGPDLFIQSPLPSILALDSLESWDIIISNTSNVADALNTWISGPVMSGITIKSVVDLGTGLPIIPIGDIYPIGVVSAMATRTFRITAGYTSCNQDSVIAYVGWNCQDGYPTSVSTYPCTPERITFTLTPLSPGFVADITGPASAIQLCDTTTFNVEAANAQLGSAYHVNVTGTLPVGMDIIPGSSQLSYTHLSPYLTISDPVFVSGTTWKWNISAANNTINTTGLVGILDTASNSFNLKFKVATDCGFISGSNIDFKILADASCGLAAEPQIFSSPGLDIIGATNPYNTTVKLSTTYVSPCAGNSTIRIVVRNDGFTPFGVTDSVVVTLPVGVPYVSGSFSGIHNAPSNGTPSIKYVSGLTYLTWKLPPGVITGDSAVFTFEYVGDPNSLSCGIIFFDAVSYSVSTVVCVATGNTCVTNIVTGDTSLAVFTYKAYLYLSNGYGTTVPNPPGGETVTLSYDITNTGQAILTDADSIVQFYFDTNSNGIYDISDAFLYADTLIIPKDSTVRFSSTFDVPAGQGCSIIAKIDPFVNACVCNPSELQIAPLRLISLGNDTTICSVNTMVMSAPPVTGYTYTWTPATDLSSASISNPVLTASNGTTAPVSTTYFLATNRIGCTSTDTIIITVNPLPFAAIAGTTSVCVNAVAPDITFTGSGSTPPYTFTYSINGAPDLTVTSAGNTATVAAPTTVAGTYIYNLISVVDASSTTCSQAQTGSATITVNPLPTATVANLGSTAACEGASQPTFVFKGTGGTAPYTITYTINGGTNQTATTAAGDSVVVSVSTAVPGAYVYALVSVQDVSSTTCFNTQSGNATVTINPLPTATIEGSVYICKGANSPDIIFVGATGTPPYTFTYTINGGSNQTVSTSGGDTARVPVSTVIDGTFVYTLVSVIDASSTTCSQLQGGTATVVVEPLPTATLTGTITVCQTAAAQITFKGFGGVPPYTFLYDLNGVVQPTVTTTAGLDSLILPVPTSATGVFNYSLISVQDANIISCTHPQTGDAIITVDPKPVADFSFTNVCHGNATVFSDSSVTAYGTITNWTWDFGDSTAVNILSDPSYIYPYAGIHTTTLYIVNNFACKDTITQPVQVYYNPVVSFTHNNECFGDTIHFTNTSSVHMSTTISSYLWVFGDGSSTSNLTNPVHYYSNPGTYNVTLVATTANNCSGVANNPVKAFDPPTSAFTFTNTCLLDSAVFTNTSTNPVFVSGTISSWSWDFGDSTPLNTTIYNPHHLYAAPGVYQVTLITHSSNLGCPDTITHPITVYPMPVADFSFMDVCLNQTMSFYDSSDVSVGTISAWTWDFGDVSSDDNTQNPTHLYANPGTYIVTFASSSSNGCWDTVQKSVVVHPLPAVDFSAINVCDGSTMYFYDSTTILLTDTLNSWAWDFGDSSAVSNSQNTSHLYAAPGPYNVQLTVTSNFGCVQSYTNVRIVNPNPVVDFMASDTAGCEPLCVYLYDSSTVITGTNVAWLWTFGDSTSTSSDKNSIHCYYNDSVFATVNYNVTLTVNSDSGCVSTLTVADYITVYPKPEADFSVAPSTATIINPVIEITDLSIGTDFWTWDFGDSDSSFVHNTPPHEYADTGAFVITLTTSTQFGCLDTAYQNITIEPDFTFYVPSAFTPNDDGMNDTFTGKGIFIKEFEMMIFDRWGNLVFFSNSFNKPWDGKANHGSQLAQRDVYVYVIKVVDIKGLEHNYKGTVTLTR